MAANIELRASQQGGSVEPVTLRIFIGSLRSFCHKVRYFTDLLAPALYGKT